MFRTAALIAFGVSIGLLAGFWIARARPARDSMERSTLESVLREDREALSARIGAQIDALRQRVEELDVGLPSSAPIERVPIEQPIPPKTGAAAAAPSELVGRLERLEGTLDRLVTEIESHRHVAVYPSAQQLRSARSEIAWGEIARVSEAMCRDLEEGLAMVRYLTFDEILERFGAPTTISGEGNWFYMRAEDQTLGPEVLELDFVNGFVVMLHSTDE